MIEASKTHEKNVYRIEKDAKMIKIDGKVYVRAILPYSDLYGAEKCKMFLQSPKREVKIVKTDIAFYCYRRTIK